MKHITMLLLAVLFFSCQTEPTEETTSVDLSRYPEAFQKILEQHGGLAQWQKMKSLSFERVNSAGNEKHLIDLPTRLDRIDAPNFQMGFDGAQYWVKADTSFKRDPIFYHNLMFYFYAMPFVLADNGISYSEAAPLQVDSTTTLSGVKMTFGDHVGDSPKDNYIVYYHPETYQMEWLAYTATYFSQEASEKYSYIRYTDWADFNGVRLPQTLTWFRTEEGQLAGPRNNVTFTAITISEEEIATETFSAPPGSRISE
jgi:hypothetical protein